MSLNYTLKEEKLQISIIAASILIVITAALMPDFRYLALIAVVLCGYSILKEFIEDLLRKEISAEALVMTALVCCVVLGEYIAAAEVAVIMSLGELMEKVVSSNARAGIDQLGKLKVDSVHVIRNGKIEDTKIEDIEIGASIRIFPGETIPLDGIIIQGSSSVDKSIITGESMPADVSEGDEVFAGTFNLFGSFDMEVSKADSESTIARMSRLLQNADSGKSRIVGAADRWSKYILAGAAVLTVSAYLLTQDIYRALTVMVVFCPCAFVLATPAGIMAAAGNMARNGVLLKDTSAIDGLCKVDTVLFDKTGTLTAGRISSLGFVDISSELPPETVEGMVSALESYSEHPLGKAISQCHTPVGKVEDFRNIPGKGVVGTVNGIRVYAGNRDLMASECPTGLEDAVSSAKDLPSTVVFVGIKDRTVGFIALEDKVKESSKRAVKELKAMGLRTVMLTGDSSAVGSSVAKKLDLDDVVWECLPETKLRTVESLEADRITCMVGDGMNDAPSLKRATVGISMGSIGNDLSVESSDVILMNDDIGRVPGLIRLCRRSVRTIYFGLTLSMAINIIGSALGILGLIGPVMGAIIHNGGSIIVIMLAATLLWSDTWNTDTNVYAES